MALKLQCWVFSCSTLFSIMSRVRWKGSTEYLRKTIVETVCIIQSSWFCVVQTRNLNSAITTSISTFANYWLGTVLKFVRAAASLFVSLQKSSLPISRRETNQAPLTLKKSNSILAWASQIPESNRREGSRSEQDASAIRRCPSFVFSGFRPAPNITPSFV